VNAARDLKAFTLFDELTEEEREAVFEELEPIDLSPDEVLFTEGDESHGLILVVEGGLRLDSKRAGPLGVVERGNAVGAVSLVAIGRREATATADGRSRVLLLRRSAFRRLVEDSPRAACRLAEAVACDLAGLVRAGLDTLAARPVDRVEGDA
jgi:CRP-like cAMP-binding protein